MEPNLRIAKFLFEDRGAAHTEYGWDNISEYRKNRYIQKAKKILDIIKVGKLTRKYRPTGKYDPKTEDMKHSKEVIK